MCRLALKAGSAMVLAWHTVGGHAALVAWLLAALLHRSETLAGLPRQGDECC